jgi:hypothetical protein
MTRAFGNNGGRSGGPPVEIFFYKNLNPAARRFFPYTSYPGTVSSRIPTTTLSQVMI